jgi:tRNA threonylcarbamoyladenosine biosynthesis protein TsaB
MKCLAIDTSGLGAAVALGEDGVLVARVDHDLRGGYAEALFGLFDDVLSVAGWTKNDLDAVAVVEGPGSFTGLRVGVMTAKTLAHARNWALRTAHASDLLAAQFGTGEHSTVRTLLSAGRAHAYVRGYRAEDGAWTAEAPAERLADAELAVWAQEQDAAILTEINYAAQIVAPEVLAAITAAPRALVDQLGICGSAGTWPSRECSVEELEPLYAGPSQAERAHGLDLSEEIRRPMPPVSWT